jgi:hypothetical protein
MYGRIVAQYKRDNWLTVSKVERVDDGSTYYRLEGIMVHPSNPVQWYTIYETCQHHMEAKKMVSCLLAQRAKLSA